jgi:hypothetical protein
VLRPPVTAILAVLAVLAALGGAAGTAGASARPDAPGRGPYGLPGYGRAEAPPACTPRACVHWVAEGPDAPAEPEAVPAVAAAVDAALDRIAALGWRPPRGDGGLGGGPQVDVYVKDLAGHAYGTATTDEGQRGEGPRHGWLALDDDVIAAAFLPSLRVDLVPHELAHLVQFAYDPHFEAWHAEATAEWLAARTGGGPDALAPRLAGWAAAPEQPLAGRRDARGVPGRAYDAAVWPLWLAGRHGDDVVRAVWEHAAQARPGASFVPAAVDAALAGRSSFAAEFARFAAANAEWRSPASGFAGVPADRFGDVRRAGVLAPGAGRAGVVLDHTAFALLDVPPPADGAGLELRGTAPAGTASALALVARRGPADGGQVVAGTADLPRGGPGAVVLPPGRYDRITAVVVNADVSVTGGGRRDAGGQWAYARDRQPYAVEVVRGAPGGPAAGARAPETAPTATGGAAAGPARATGGGNRSRDRRAPAVRIARVAPGGAAVRVVVRVDEACTVRAEVRTGGRARAAATFRLRPGRWALRLPARGPARGARLRLAATDAAGNRTVVSRRLGAGG